MNNSAKKIVTALIVTAVASLGLASPSSAQPVKKDSSNGGIMQMMRIGDGWCC